MWMACGIVGGEVCPSYKTLIGTHVNFIGNLLKVRDKKIWLKELLLLLCTAGFCMCHLRDFIEKVVYKKKLNDKFFRGIFTTFKQHFI